MYFKCGMMRSYDFITGINATGLAEPVMPLPYLTPSRVPYLPTYSVQRCHPTLALKYMSPV